MSGHTPWRVLRAQRRLEKEGPVMAYRVQGVTPGIDTEEVWVPTFLDTLSWVGSFLEDHDFATVVRMPSTGEAFDEVARR